MEAQERATEAAGTQGEKLDEAVEQVGAAIEDKLTPPAEKVADKVVDQTGGMPDDRS